MEILLSLMVFAAIPALIARSKGRSAFAWWLYGFFLLPIALVHSIVTDNPKRNRICPFCKLKIMNDAMVCQHCHREVGPAATPLYENRIIISGDSAPPPDKSAAPAANPGLGATGTAILIIAIAFGAIVGAAQLLTGTDQRPAAGPSEGARAREAAVARCKPLKGGANYLNCYEAAMSGALRPE